VRADSGGLDGGRPVSSASIVSWRPACIPAVSRWLDRLDGHDPWLDPMFSWTTECRRTLEVDQDAAARPVESRRCRVPTVSSNRPWRGPLQ
jgi:hypothetical protein